MALLKYFPPFGFVIILCTSFWTPCGLTFLQRRSKKRPNSGMQSLEREKDANPSLMLLRHGSSEEAVLVIGNDTSNPLVPLMSWLSPTDPNCP